MMRAWALVLIACAVVLIAGCGSPPAKPYARVVKHGRISKHRLGDVATPAAGDVFTAGTGRWSGSPTGFAYLWEDCDSGGANCTTAAGSPTNTSRYMVVTGDTGFTIRVKVTASYAGQPDASITSAPTGVVAGASQFAVDDEFNGTSIDQTTWSMLDVPGENDQSEPECYFPSQETETGGSMTLTAAFASTAVACDNNTGGNATTHYPSGAINMHWDNFTYGTVEIRAKMQNAGGAWPALWMLGYKCQDPTTGAYLSNGGIYPTACNTPFSTGTEENDIADVFSNSTAHQTLHTPAAGPPFNNAVDCATPEPSQTAFHTYDMIWSSGHVTWSIDGTQVCSYSGADVPSTPEFVIFNMAVGSIGGGTITNSSLPQSSFVDYVHVTSSGAAQNTVAPSISGTATHGDVLTVANGTWTNSPTSYTYQWMRDRTTLISGATSSSYTLTTGDEGHTINCMVIAHNSNGAMAVSTANTATVN